MLSTLLLCIDVSTYFYSQFDFAPKLSIICQIKRLHFHSFIFWTPLLRCLSRHGIGRNKDHLVWAHPLQWKLYLGYSENCIFGPPDRQTEKYLYTNSYAEAGYFWVQAGHNKNLHHGRFRQVTTNINLFAVLLILIYCKWLLLSLIHVMSYIRHAWFCSKRPLLLHKMWFPHRIQVMHETLQQH